MSKKAVIFPGIGYHADRPLLYFAAKLAVAAGYEIIKIDYPHCAVDLLKADKEVLKEFSVSCVETAVSVLKEKEINADDELLFISKSIGTAVAAACAQSFDTKIGHIYFTPLEDTFDFVSPGSGMAFNGTNDSWADHKKVAGLCKAKDIPLTTIEGANHSLETGEVITDIGNLQKIMEQVAAYIKK